MTLRRLSPVLVFGLAAVVAACHANSGVVDGSVDLAGVDRPYPDGSVDLGGVDRPYPDGSVDLGGADQPHPGGPVDLGGADRSSPLGWRQVWADEFDGAAGTAVNGTRWTFDQGGGGWGNQELENYTNRTDNAALDGNGNLVITARKESLGGSDYTSARLKTQGLATWTYGRVEARIQLPSGQGIWPAFWMLGEDIPTAGWPKCGEIDIMENIGREPNLVHGTIHGPGYSGAAGLGQAHSLPEPVAAAFHVFAIEWEVDTIRWYVDDALALTKTSADLPAGTTWVFSHPFFIILNVAVGGGWPGNPDATTVFPQRMLVDYVRVYQR